MADNHWVQLYEPACRELVKHMTRAFMNTPSDNPCFWSVSSIDKTLDSLSSTLQASQDVLSPMMRTLRRERNNRTRINCIPVELMVYIFKFAGQSDEEEDYGGYRTTLNISHTCSSWRAVSLEYPDLWTYISLTMMSEPIALLFVKRSARCPLFVEYNQLKSTHPYLETFIRTRLRRAISVKLRLVNTLLPYLPLCIPYDQLQELDLTSPWLPKNLIRHRMPRLRRLTLNSFALAAGPISLHSLAYLTVSINDESRSHLLHVLEIFREAPSLQSISLKKNRDSPGVGHQLYARDRIHLSSVRNINLRAAEKDMYFILSAIALPPSAIVTLSVPSEPSRIGRCFAGNKQCLPLLYEFTTVVISDDENASYKRSPWKIKFTASKVPVSPDASIGSVTVHIGQTHWKNSSDDLKQIVRVPMQKNTGTVTSLSFEGLQFFSHEQQDKAYAVLLSSLPNLRTIRLVSCPRSSLSSLGKALSLRSHNSAVSLELGNMAVSTTALLDMCQANRSQLRGEEIILCNCKLRSDGIHTGWSGDLSIIRCLGIKVKLLGDTMSISQPPEDPFALSWLLDS